VPKLTGLSRSAAKLVLEAATCRLGNATRQRQRKGTTQGNALVRRQSRKAGTEWPAGTRVNVVLAKKKAAKRRG
jgi:beta-lactam-binding protein with PASTA domain